MKVWVVIECNKYGFGIYDVQTFYTKEEALLVKQNSPNKDCFHYRIVETEVK
jgi:hypothetical protein